MLNTVTVGRTTAELAAEPQATEPSDGSECCRFCSTPLRHTFVDLGMSPLCESYVSAENLSKVEHFYPLHAHVCEECFLVQLPVLVSAQQIFTEYAYFSSYSDSWLKHASDYVDMITARLGLNVSSLAIELAFNFQRGISVGHYAELPSGSIV